MSDLYTANSLSCFTGPGASSPSPESMARAAAKLVPGGADILASAGWAGLLDAVLGEGQFGPDRYRLSRFKRMYYECRPWVPRAFTTIARRGFRMQQERAFALGWPVEDRYIRFLYRILARQPESPATIEGWRGPACLPWSDLWPEQARFAFVLTHDVEGAAGQSFVNVLADLDERYGFRSSFNFVPEAYSVDQSLLVNLRQRGFEVGVHGLNHDGKLFSSEPTFLGRTARINHYLREWDAVGFRSPFTHRNPEWMQALEIEYDSSFFDTDPYETMPGGTMSIWPFFCGRFVELPYTLVQDHMLLITLGERTPQRWLEKVDFVASWGGMALVNVHPDYMREPALLAVYEAFLREMARRRHSASAGAAASGYWHALPRDVARWWRTRALHGDQRFRASGVRDETRSSGGSAR